MLEVLAYLCAVLAVVAFATSLLLSRALVRFARPGGPPARFSSPVVPLAVMAATSVFFAGLAVTAAALDDREDDQYPRPAATVDGPLRVDLGMAGADHAGFARISQIHSGPLASDLCLGRFYTDNGSAGEWWTDCGTARSLDTVAQARRRLALKNEWGSYNRRAEYTLPAGRDVTYAYGEIAPQCRTGSKPGCPRYRGGGVQYWFRGGLDPGTALENERCAQVGRRKRTDPPSNARYGRC